MDTYLIYFIQIMFGFSVFLNALLFIPQGVRLLKTKSANNISLMTFLGFNFIQFFTILHGYLTRDYTLMVGFILSFISCGFVTILILRFRKNYV